MRMIEKYEPQIRELKFTLHLIKRSPLTLVGLGIITFIILVSVFAPWIAPYDPNFIDSANRLAPPTLKHLLGTGTLGRDLISRIIFGARISMVVGLVIVGLAAVVGSIMGLIAGYFGGKVGEGIMRITDVFMAFPYLVLAMAVTAALGPSLINSMFAMAIVWWPMYTRLMYSEVIIIKKMLYVEAAKSMGARENRILFKHILPNALTSVLIQGTLDFGAAIMYSASLSFIGLGAQPPTPEWGAIISDSRNYMMFAWWYPTFPGLAILITVLSTNLLGDGLRDILDPRLRRLVE
jgi:peptide/nickel transport system permease protein